MGDLAGIQTVYVTRSSAGADAIAHTDPDCRELARTSFVSEYPAASLPDRRVCAYCCDARDSVSGTHEYVCEYCDDDEPIRSAHTRAKHILVTHPEVVEAALGDDSAPDDGSQPRVLADGGEVMVHSACDSPRIETLVNTNANGDPAGHEYYCYECCEGIDESDTEHRQPKEDTGPNTQGVGKILDEAPPDASWEDLRNGGDAA